MKNPKKFEGTLSSGAIGMLHASKNHQYPDEHLYSIYIHPHNGEINDFWNEIFSNPQKPCSIPNFYGSFREDSGALHAVFDYIPNDLKSYIKENQNQNKRISRSKLYEFSKNLVNTLAFLQSKKITHIGLRSENIWMNLNSNLVYVIDFVKEDEFKNCSCLARFLNSQKNDNFLINPYKFNVFALGLIILEMGISDFSTPGFENFMNRKQLFEKWLDEQITLFEQTYNFINTDLESENTSKLIEIIKQCLILNEQKRPDFVDLFLKKIKNDSKILQRFIFLDDKLMLSQIDKFKEKEPDPSSEKDLLETQTEISKINFRKKFISDFVQIQFNETGNIKKYNKIIQPFNKIEIEMFILKIKNNYVMILYLERKIIV